MEPGERNFILDIVTYPFRGGGLPILIVGTIILALTELAAWVPLLGLFAYLFVFAYLSGLYFELIQLSSGDDEDIYSFPDLSDPIDDIFLPAVKVLWVVLLAFAPYTAWSIWGDPDHLHAGPIEWALIAWAAFYFPMAMLATVILGTFGAALPHIVIPAIFRSGPLYLLAAAMIAGIYLLENYALDSIAALSYFAFPLVAFVGMLVLMWNARTLGLLFQRREEQLAWF